MFLGSILIVHCDLLQNVGDVRMFRILNVYILSSRLFFEDSWFIVKIVLNNSRLSLVSGRGTGLRVDFCKGFVP